MSFMIGVKMSLVKVSVSPILFLARPSAHPILPIVTVTHHFRWFGLRLKHFDLQNRQCCRCNTKKHCNTLRRHKLVLRECCPDWEEENSTKGTIYCCPLSSVSEMECLLLRCCDRHFYLCGLSWGGDSKGNCNQVTVIVYKVQHSFIRVHLSFLYQFESESPILTWVM